MAREAIDIVVRLRNARAVIAEANATNKAVRGVGTSAREAGRGADQSRRAFRGLGAGFLGLRTVGISAAGALGFGGGAGLAFAFKTMIDEARQAQNANKQTAAVLKSTGGTAGQTVKSIQSLATQLSNMSGEQDDAIQSGENLLLTFRNIRGKAFVDTTKAALDMAAGMTAAGKSMSFADAVLQLGKAMNDPEKGMQRLARVGVTFSKSQIALVKRLQDSGDTLGAQRVILREVNKEFAGSAKAQAEPLKLLQQNLRNTAQTLGVQLLPYINKGALALSKFLAQMQTGTGAGGRFVVRMRGVGLALLQVARVLIAVGRGFAAWYRGIVSVYRGIDRATRGMVQVVRSLLNGDMRGAVNGTKRIFSGLLVALRGYFRTIGGGTVMGLMIRAASALRSRVGGSIRGLESVVRGALGAMRSAFTGFAGTVRRFGGSLFSPIAAGFKAAMNTVIAGWNSLSFSVPKVDLGPLGSVGGGRVGVTPIQPLARGGKVTAPVQLVGERGPELVTLPPGSNVTPNNGVLTNHINVYIDGRLVTKSVERTLLNQMARA